MIWVAFGVGLFLGTIAGVLIVGFCRMAAQSHEEAPTTGPWVDQLCAELKKVREGRPQ